MLGAPCQTVDPVDVFINPPVGEPLVITVRNTPPNLCDPTDVLDLSAATAATLTVRRPGGGILVTWTATISEQSYGSLKLTHLFAAGDMPDVGFYVVVATLTFPSGPRRMQPRVLNGIDPFMVPGKLC